MPQVKIVEYWSNDSLPSTLIFSQIFSQDRYLSILQSLHLVDMKVVKRSSGKFAWFTRDLKNIFCPFENLCIDESLMLFKGRLSFKQFIPWKRHRLDVRFFVLCDCGIEYIIDFIICTCAGSDLIVGDCNLGISGWKHCAHPYEKLLLMLDISCFQAINRSASNCITSNGQRNQMFLTQ